MRAGEAVREIALLRQRLEPAAALPERDVLTGLLSAAGMHATAPALLDLALGDKVTQLLLVIDIARLRDVNGLHGFGFGDDLLRQFARRLTKVTAARPTAARMGGDRFALLVANPAGAEAAAAMAVAVDRCPRPPVRHRRLRGQRARACRGGAVSRSRQRLRPADARGRAGAGELAPDRWPLAHVRSAAQSSRGRPQVDGEGAQARRRARRAAAALSAAGRPRREKGPGGRGAAALAAPRAWPGGAADLHPDRRGQRPDPADRRLGAGRGLPIRAPLA